MIDRSTGLPIDEDAHIRQSVRDILTTPVGSRIERRDYGSLLPDLIDHPGNAANRLRLSAATIMAILRWEPRLRPTSTGITLGIDGKVEIELNAVKRTGPAAGQSMSITQTL